MALLHQNQHAGRSCNSALHQVVRIIERSLNNKEVVLAAFFRDIQGAFNSTTPEFTLEAIRTHGVDQQKSS